MRENRGELKELLKSGSPDPAAVGKLVIQEHKLREQGKAQREQSKQALRALLTPEQQAKFDVLQSMKRGRGDMGPGSHAAAVTGADAAPTASRRTANRGRRAGLVLEGGASHPPDSRFARRECTRLRSELAELRRQTRSRSASTRHN